MSESLDLAKAEALTMVRLRQLDTIGRRIIGEHYRVRCCIAATRIGLDVLKTWGIDAFPVAVSAHVLNRDAMDVYEHNATEAERPRAKHLAIEADGISDRVSKEWGGHLVIEVPLTGAVGYPSVLLDLSVSQFDRPDHGLQFDSGLFPLEGWPGIWRNAQDVTILYRKAKTRSYRETKDWNDRETHAKVAARIIEATWS